MWIGFNVASLSSSSPTHLHAASIVEGGCKPAAAVLLGSRRRQRQPHIGAAEALRLRRHGHSIGILYLWRRLGLACTRAGGSGCVAASILTLAVFTVAIPTSLSRNACSCLLSRLYL